MDIKKTLDKNASSIFTGTAIASSAAAVIFAHQAGRYAESILESERRARLHTKQEPVTRKEALMLTWKAYIPAGVSLLFAVTSIVMLNRAGENKAASVSAAAMVSHKLMQDYVEKIEERLGETAVQEVRDEMAHEHISADPVKEVIVLSDNADTLIRDGFSGRYFRANKHVIDSAVNQVNHVINDIGYASLTDFYDEIGLEPTDISDHIGWNRDELLSVEYGGALAADGQPCLEVCFRCVPFSGYNRFL